jgi:hypothetical protein
MTLANVGAQAHDLQDNPMKKDSACNAAIFA